MVLCRPQAYVDLLNWHSVIIPKPIKATCACAFAILFVGHVCPTPPGPITTLLYTSELLTVSTLMCVAVPSANLVYRVSEVTLPTLEFGFTLSSPFTYLCGVQIGPASRCFVLEWSSE